MRKLILLIIFVLSLSMCAYADTFDFSEITKKVDVPTNYTDFTSWHDIGDDVNYILSWSGDDSDGGVLTVVADEKMRIKSYSKYEYGKYMGNYKLSAIDYNHAVEIATNFLQKTAPEFFDKLVIVNQNNYIAKNNENYNIIFYRYENNIPCYSDFVTVSVDAYTMEPVEYNAVWNDYDRISPSYRTINKNEAIKLYFEKIGLVLAQTENGLIYTTNNKYINAYTGNLFYTSNGLVSIEQDTNLTSEKAYEIMLENFDFTLQYVPIIEDEKLELRAVYGFEQTFPVNVDANSGNLCTYEGIPYKKSVERKYTDIDDSSSKKQIETLLLAGVTPFLEPEFNPEKEITKSEFASMIYLALGKEITVYEDGFITNEQAVEQLINAMGYGKIAYLQDTFRADFIDAEHITKSRVGCASIAQGLGLINGNAFLPKKNATRAYCTELIYNTITDEAHYERTGVKWE